MLFISLQLIPLPAGFVKFLSPHIYEAYSPILDLQESKQWIPFTISQKATLLELLRISCYAAFYVLTVQLLSHKDQLTKTVRIVVCLASGIAFLAILQKFTSPDVIYWFRATPETAHPGGPWVYKNHYAGFMELVFPLILALFFYYRPNINEDEPWRTRMVSIFSAPGSNIHFLLGFAAVLALCSVLITLSRGGAIAINLGLFLFLILLTRKKPKTGKVLFLLVLAGMLLLVSWLGWQPILARFNIPTTEPNDLLNGRWMVWQDCGLIIRDFLFTGSGFGTFEKVYPQYSSISTFALFDHAHNDYIELITDGGLLGFGLVAWFVIAVLRNGIKQLKKRRDSYSVLLTIAGITAIFSILLHSITDFNMHNGANGLYFFFICGLLVSAGNTRLHFRTRPTLLRLAHKNTRLLYLSGIPLLLLAIFLQGGIIQANRQYLEIEKIYINPRLSERLFTKLHTTIDKAIQYDPLESYYSYYKGNIFSYQQSIRQATDSYIDASMKNPLEGAYLQRIAMSMAQEKNEKATELMAEGYRRSLNKETLVFTWAEWLLQQNRNEEAGKALQRGVMHFPSLAKQLPPLLLANNFSRNEIRSILPEKTTAWIQLGKYAERMGKLEEAEYFRLHALDFLAKEETVKPWYFTQIYWLYKKQKNEDAAADILRRGIEWLPNYSKFHIYLGNYYQAQGITYRALEEYQQVLLLEPGNIKIKKQVEKLRK